MIKESKFNLLLKLAELGDKIEITIVKPKDTFASVKMIHLQLSNFDDKEIKELLKLILDFYEKKPNYEVSFVTFNDITIVMEEEE
ncbi:MAG: hypothetical protein DRJ31_10360 [Candidatus Methanomethylicota archaeon]|uniref:Uncharacterized protein n=1 Tax=Thermoproteota archaeon TaxID=2056631 RepID=A0A497EKI5_9CREN|nr:MAG: hypothetical protein DRJ31_10360 [Candidatus Verstraetearchaeota archaeon]